MNEIEISYYNDQSLITYLNCIDYPISAALGSFNENLFYIYNLLYAIKHVWPLDKEYNRIKKINEITLGIMSVLVF